MLLLMRLSALEAALVQWFVLKSQERLDLHFHPVSRCWKTQVTLQKKAFLYRMTTYPT
jgi:hypothetical protein